jgi:hypothetical protein
MEVLVMMDFVIVHKVLKALNVRLDGAINLLAITSLMMLVIRAVNIAMLPLVLIRIMPTN